MTNHIIETVIFKLAHGISKADFLEAVPSSTAFIKSRSGFVCRRLSSSEDGTWIEHIEWKTMEDAKAASDAFMNDAEILPFLQLIDGPAAVLHHTQLEVSLG